MKTQVIGQLGMEGGGEDVPLPHGNGEPVDPGEYLHAGADLFNERRSDEHGFEGRLIRWIAVRCGERAQLQRSREAVDLPPEGVPAHGSVQEADARLPGMIEDVRAEQDKPRTRAEYGHPAPDQLAHTVHHAPFDKELAHDRAFAAGKHEAGETFEVFPRADFHGFGSAETERADVFSEGPLNGISWNTGATLILLMFAAVTLGGLGTANGALIGSLVIGIVADMSSLVIPNDMRYASALAILIIVLLVRPQGIFGKQQRVG